MLRSLPRMLLTSSLALTLVAVVVLALGSAQNAHAASASMPRSTDWSVPGACGATIQACINNASVQNGDNLLIATGIYTESLFLIGKAISLTGESATKTIIVATPGSRALYIDTTVSQTVVISGLTFTGGNIAGSGGGIANIATAPVILQHAIIVSNVASAAGGGLYSSIDMTLTNVAFYNNAATGGYGGGAYVPRAFVSDSWFEGNRCAGNCGGGGLAASGALTLANTVFASNTSAYRGGGADSASVSMTGGWFQNNTSAGYSYPIGGGGMYVVNAATISGTQFIRNAASLYGGGLLVGYTATLTNAIFISNSTASITSAGGGAYVALVGGVPVNVSGGAFAGNTSGGSGGGLLTSGNLRMTGTQVKDNTAQFGYGGGVYGFNALLSSVSFTNNQVITSGFGGGLAIFGPVTGTNLIFAGNGSGTLGGGGAYAYSAVLTNPQFINNRAGGYYGGGMYANVAILNGGFFTGNVAPLLTGGGGMVAASAGSISGTLFYSNSTGGWGGGAYVQVADALLVNTRFISNTAGRDGGGLFSFYTATLTNPLFMSNTAAYAGGGAFAGWSSGGATVNGGSFSGNASGTGGGGLFTRYFLVLSGTQFLSNTANGINGGGAWTQGNANATNVTFTHNRLMTGNNSGGLDVLGSLTLTNGYFFRNSNSAYNGGAIGVGGHARVLNSQFVSNTTAWDGGGLLVYGSLVLSNSQFLGNTAGQHGGGANVGGTAQVVNSQFISNSTTWDGGGAIVWGTLALSNSQFITNTAGRYGGGFANYGASTNVLGSTLRNNRSGNAGGGAYGYTLTVESSRFELNRSTGASGGGMYSNNYVLLSNTLALNNSANWYGGGIQGYGPAYVQGGLFQNNTSGLNGAGMSINGTIDVTGTQFISNVTGGYLGAGGGAAAATFTVTVNNGYFALNRANTSRGGALWTGSGVALTGSTFLTNSAVVSDGGAVAALGPAAVVGGSFRSNTSGAHGGAVYAGRGLALDSARLVGNSADSGGAAYIEQDNATIVNTLFARNNAVTTLGAGLHSVTTGTVQVMHATLANPSLVNSRGIYVVSSTLRISDSIIAGFVQGVEAFGADVFEDYNLFYGNTSNTFGVVNGGHSLVGSPAFANAANDDYHLTAASLAIDEAYPLGIATDFEGQARPQGAAPDIGFDESSFTAAADLSVGKSAVRASAAPGQPVTFTLAFAHAGPQIAHQVVLTDAVPLEITSVAVVSSIPITPVSASSWLLGDLMPGSSGVLTITGVFSPNLDGITTFTNTATIASATGDPAAGNNTSSATLTLLQLVFASSTFSVNENVGSGVANVTVNLIPASSLTVTVNYSATAGTATAGSDFFAVNGVLTFAPGQTAQSFPVPIINDALPEVVETVVPMLLNPVGAVFLSPDTATLTIVDDDAAAYIYLPMIVR